MFGEPFSFWQTQMPVGMFLRSSYRACYISAPRGDLTLAKYEQALGLAPEPGPVSLERFTGYGLWFQQHAAPDVDRRRIRRIERAGAGFSLSIDDGETLAADRVVVAAGISPFAYRPPEFAHLSNDLVSHSSEHRTFDEFAGRRVLVVGAGQSALESAALLHEAGAVVEVVGRGPTFRWNPTGTVNPRTPAVVKRIRHRLHYLKYPPHDVGPPGWNWLVASPDIWRLLPRDFRPTVEQKVNYPRGATWLVARLADVPMYSSTSVTGLKPDRSGVRVDLADGSSRTVDHVLLGTGFKVDVRRYDFLGQDILSLLRVRHGYPVLGPGLESSVPGLHFLGAPAAMSYGPVMRFVCGSAYGARALARRVAGRRQRRLDFAW